MKWEEPEVKTRKTEEFWKSTGPNFVITSEGGDPRMSSTILKYKEVEDVQVSGGYPQKSAPPVSGFWKDEKIDEFLACTSVFVS